MPLCNGFKASMRGTLRADIRPCVFQRHLMLKANWLLFWRPASHITPKAIQITVRWCEVCTIRFQWTTKWSSSYLARSDFYPVSNVIKSFHTDRAEERKQHPTALFGMMYLHRLLEIHTNQQIYMLIFVEQKKKMIRWKEEKKLGIQNRHKRWYYLQKLSNKRKFRSCLNRLFVRRAMG